MLPKKLKWLASLRLAIFVILSLAVVSGVGTIMEARYDAEVAQRLVYHSIYMYAVIVLLCINLTAVMADRWPWRQHHMGFVLAHIGIIILFIGSWLTQRYGIDGSIAFAIGEERKTVVVRERELKVFSTMDGTSFREVYSKPVEFLTKPPTASEPYRIQMAGDEIVLNGYEHFAFREAEIKPGVADFDGPAIRFQLENPNVNVTEWLRREIRREKAELDLGPAKVILATQALRPEGKNAIVLVSQPDQESLDVWIHGKDNSVRPMGRVRQGETIETGWMGLKFRLLRYLPKSREVVNYAPSPTASPLSTSAVKLTFDGNDYWLGLNSVLRLYKADRMYILSYGFRQIDLTFPLRLLQFEVGTYEGTERAASYESLVEVPGRGPVKISMNEPLYFQGFTFYQSSFEKDASGKATTSILSVNYDPGRWIKYVGSMLMVIGSVVLFYFRRVQWLGSLKQWKEKS